MMSRVYLRCAAPCASAVFIFAAFLTLDPARAEVSFEGKTIYLLISSRTGGGTDRIGRLVGKNLAKYLPGKPDIIFRNMPGGGGIKAINHLVSRVKPDGQTFLIGAGNQLNPTNLRRKVVKYDPRKLGLIGGFANDSSIFLINKEAVKRLTDPSAKPVVVGAIDGTRSGLQMAFWGAEVLGWNIKWVLGYGGTSAMALAAERGETDVFVNNNLFRIRPLIESGKFANFVQTGALFQGKIVPHSKFPNVPLFADLVKGKLKGRALRAFHSWQRRAQIGKWFTLPPKIPAAYLTAYRRAFKKAAMDPEFRKYVSKRISPDYKMMSAKDLAAIVDDMVNTSDDTLKYDLEVRKKQGLPLGKRKRKRNRKKKN